MLEFKDGGEVMPYCNPPDLVKERLRKAEARLNSNDGKAPLNSMVKSIIRKAVNFWNNPNNFKRYSEIISTKE